MKALSLVRSERLFSYWIQKTGWSSVKNRQKICLCLYRLTSN